MLDGPCWIVMLLAGLPSCVLGGGPFIAYGQNGWTGGLESGAGVSIIEANVGVDIRERAASPYVRGDLVPFADVVDQSNPAPGQSVDLRLGAGWSGEHGATFLAGGGGQTFLRRAPFCNTDAFRVDALALLGSVELQVRFSGGWSIALAPRIDVRAAVCERT